MLDFFLRMRINPKSGCGVAPLIGCAEACNDQNYIRHAILRHSSATSPSILTSMNILNTANRNLEHRGDSDLESWLSGDYISNLPDPVLRLWMQVAGTPLWQNESLPRTRIRTPAIARLMRYSHLDVQIRQSTPAPLSVRPGTT